MYIHCINAELAKLGGMLAHEINFNVQKSLKIPFFNINKGGEDDKCRRDVLFFIFG